MEPRRVPGPGRRRAGVGHHQPASGRPAALRPFPFPADAGGLRFRFPAHRGPQTGRRPGQPPFHRRGPPHPFLGQPGCGKTHLAVALATRAVEAGYRGYFTTADDMVTMLARAKRRDLGVQAQDLHRPHRAGHRRRRSATHGPRRRRRLLPCRQPPLRQGHPTLVTTNRGLPEWGEVFGDPVVAAAILDRILHRAVVFNIKGPSWRCENTKPSTRPPPSPIDSEGGAANLSIPGTGISSARDSVIARRGFH